MNTFEDQAVLNQVRRIEAYATDVRPASASGRTSWAMAWLHLVIWHSWRGTYYYADKYPEEDYENYRQYALLSFTHLADHHDVEENGLFPALERKASGIMKHNKEQHESFLKELTDIITYLNTTTSPEKFDVPTFKSKVDNILLPVMTHLADELDSLKADFLLMNFNEEELDEINKESHAAQGPMDKSKMLPFILQNLPQPSPFPPAPGFVKNIISPWMMYWKYKDLWKYTTYPYKSSLPSVPSQELKPVIGTVPDEL